MTYDEFIQNIIDIRGQWCVPETGIYEIHHILPRCMGGLPVKIHTHDIKHTNLIWLTPAEHFTAHKLLVEKYPDNNKLVYAFWQLSNNYAASPEDYELAKRLYSNIRHNSVQSAEANKKRSETMKGHKLFWYTDGLHEIRAEKCPEGYKPGRANKIKEISRKYFGKSLPGEKNGMYGKHHTEASNKKRSEWGHARHWYTNNVIEVFDIQCPEGFKPGRLKKGAKNADR